MPLCIGFMTDLKGRIVSWIILRNAGRLRPGELQPGFRFNSLNWLKLWVVCRSMIKSRIDTSGISIGWWTNRLHSMASIKATLTFTSRYATYMPITWMVIFITNTIGYNWIPSRVGKNCRIAEFKVEGISLRGGQGWKKEGERCQHADWLGKALTTRGCVQKRQATAGIGGGCGWWKFSHEFDWSELILTSI